MAYRSKFLPQRQRILDAAARLFWEKGFIATSVSDIAKEADFNKATVYYYFKSKTSILYEIASTAIDELTKLAMSVVDSDLPPLEKLRVLLASSELSLLSFY